jgi:hypothetical protein
MSKMEMPIDWLEDTLKRIREPRYSFICDHETCYGKISLHVCSDGRYIISVSNIYYDGLDTKSAKEARDYYCKFVDDANNYALQKGGEGE